MSQIEILRMLSGHTSAIYSLTILQDGRLVSGSGDKSIKIRNPKDNFNCSRTLTGHSGVIYSLTRLQDGRLVPGSEDKTIKI